MDEVRKKSLKEVLPKNEIDFAGRKPAPVRRKKTAAAPVSEASEDFYRARQYTGRSKSSYFLWACLVLVLIVGGYYLSAAFASVTVKVTPRQAVVALSGQYEANRAPSDGIEFSVIKLEEEAEKQVPASGQTKVETKAKGTVVIYNNYSSAAQPLAASTRLETKEGYIFRMDSAATVPGTTKKGTAITPGSVTVKVSAAEAGDKYNVGTAEFKIVGFKGTAKYDKFSAKSTSGMGGGKIGTESTVEEKDRTAAVAQMQKDLSTQVKEKARLQIPKGFAIIDGTDMITFTDEIAAGDDPAKATIKTKATMIAILFDLKNLGQNFAEKEFPGEATDGITVSNPEDLKFSLLNKDSFNFEKTDRVSFNLTGKINLVWPVNTTDLKAKLVSSPIKNKDAVFAGYPSIYRAEAVVRPPWVMSFPSNPAKINVKLLVQ